MPSKTSGIHLDQALAAQQALRKAANLPPEVFPVPAFVGMISDEIEALRRSGRSDDEIVDLIRANSTIEVTADEIAKHYASPEDRGSEDRGERQGFSG